MTVTVENISRRFRSFQAVDNVSLTAETGELLALLGPSGSGKTTLLRLIAGLEKPDHGAVYFDGEDVTNLDVRHRKVGFVFQHYGLFRHMTVSENIAFGLKVKRRRDRPSKPQIAARVTELLKLVQLESLGERHPDQLSGGQKQRVALARALAVGPRVLLLDEPFGALDARVRKDLRRWLRRLHNEFQLTTIVVTHDQEEAMELADRVVVMNHAKIEQVASPRQIYDQPANPFVFRFLGAGTKITLTDSGSGELRAANGIHFSAELKSQLKQQQSESQESHFALFVRAHEFDLTLANIGSGGATIKENNDGNDHQHIQSNSDSAIGKILLSNFTGPSVRFVVQLQSLQLERSEREFEVEISREIADHLRLRDGCLVEITARTGIFLDG